MSENSFKISLIGRVLQGPLLGVALSACLLPGCHSSFVSATVENRTGATVNLLEVDYPSASFGADHLANGANYPYHFKIQGSGRLEVQYSDAFGKRHTAKGPLLDEGEQGELHIVLLPSGEPQFITSFATER